MVTGTADARELEQIERTPGWFSPQRKRSTVYEDVSVDVQHSVHRHAPSYFVNFPDGRKMFWDDSTVLKVGDWYAFRDPGELWERPFYQTTSANERAIESTLRGAQINDLYSVFRPEWRSFLADEVVPLSLVEYGLTGPLASGFRRGLSDTIANCLAFNAGYKLREAQSLALYTLELEREFPGILTDNGKKKFLEDAAWQPTRRFLEKLETVTDWGEIIVAANVCFEPLVGTLCRREILMYGASLNGDLVTPTFGHVAQWEWEWARAWTIAFVQMVVGDEANGQANEAVIRGWAEDWGQLALEAVGELRPILERVDGLDVEAAVGRVREGHAALLDSAGVASKEA